MMIQIACISLCLLVVVDSFQNSLRIMKIKSSIMINQMSKSQSNWELSLLSPCKINLFLRILERRPTGYRTYIYI